MYVWNLEASQNLLGAPQWLAPQLGFLLSVWEENDAASWDSSSREEG